MSNETQNTETIELVETVQDETTSVAPETLTEDQPTLSALDSAIQARMGNFSINISPADLKYVKNLLNNKIEWKGPNEAYLMIMALISISNELKEYDTSSTARMTINLPSTTLESINFFLSRITGKGEESAHRLFAVSMLLRPALEEIKRLDTLIETLKSEDL